MQSLRIFYFIGNLSIIYKFYARISLLLILNEKLMKSFLSLNESSDRTWSSVNMR